MDTIVALSKHQVAIKRLFDILLSSTALVIVMPIFVLVSLMIKIGSPGPVFYKFRRFSSDGRELFIFRFRTMYIDSELNAITNKPTGRDPRITQLGMFLRRTALDQLPELLNVLVGDLSMVGPRPKHIAEYDRYKAIAGSVICLKPGITFITRGIGYGSGVGADETLHTLLESEKKYVKEWSLWLDLRIFGQTIWRSLFLENAY